MARTPRQATPGAQMVSIGEQPESENRGVLTWMAEARCKGKGRLFFPAPAERLQARRLREGLARVLCHACPVLTACRQWARVHGERGFWGAESEEQRASAGFMPLGITFGMTRR
ncbi:MAG: WhiB family transcriptional regulator [Acidimicrobiia bacterium]